MLINKGSLAAALAAFLPAGPAPAWTASTSIAAYARYVLPTGGLGYSTVARTTRSSWDATERATWTFLAGGHQEVYTASGSWVGPTGITNILSLELLGGGAGGCGGGSSTAAINQVGGNGGTPGERVIKRKLTVTPGTTYTLTVGAGGAGGAGGAAAGNNAGVAGGDGGTSLMTIGSSIHTARGGPSSSVSAANSTAQSNVSTAGGLFSGGAWVSTPGIPGSGAIAISVFGYPPQPLNGVIGGGGGGPAVSGTGKGGLGGGAKTAPDTAISFTAAGGSGTSSGGNGTAATELGCGGGGGGGGCSGGAGGTGGAGAAGRVVIEY